MKSSCPLPNLQNPTIVLYGNPGKILFFIFPILMLTFVPDLGVSLSSEVFPFGLNLYRL